jgi:predicted SAM-dependent methyltransferase
MTAAPRKLDVGSGATHEEGYASIDITDAFNPDYVHDITQIPWPFEDASFDVLRCSHILEHIDRSLLVAVMNEMHRILVPGGMLKIESPVAPHWKAFADPTHVSLLVPQTFLYFADNSSIFHKLYGMEKWDLVQEQIDEEGVFHCRMDADGGIMQIDLLKPS